MGFGKKLKALRKSRNLTQEELADELGYSRQIISAWERGSHHPGLDKLETICGYFGVSSTYFIEEEQKISVEADGEMAITETKDSMAKSKSFVHKGWKIVFGITLTILILSVLLIVSFVLLNIDFESEGYYNYMQKHHFNIEPKYIALYIGLLSILILNTILFVISLKKIKRGNNRD